LDGQEGLVVLGDNVGNLLLQGRLFDFMMACLPESLDTKVDTKTCTLKWIKLSQALNETIFSLAFALELVPLLHYSHVG
jgi:hypothetical protein